MSINELIKYARETNYELFYKLIGSKETMDLIKSFLINDKWYALSQESKGYNMFCDLIEDKAPIRSEKYDDLGIEMNVYMTNVGYFIDISLDGYHQVVFNS